MLKTFQVHQQQTMVSNQTTTLQIPTGGKIHDIIIRFNDVNNVTTTIAEIRTEVTGNIRLSFGGKDLLNVPLARLLDIIAMGGSRTGVGGTLVPGGIQLNVSKLFYDDPKAAELFGLGTADVTNIQLQIGAGTIDDAGTVQVFTTRTAENQPLGTYWKLIDYPRNYNTAAQDTVDTLPRNLNSCYLAIFTNAGASGVISYSEVRVNGAIVREAVPFHANRIMNSSHGWNDAAGDSLGEGVYCNVIFADGALDSYLPMKNVTDLRILTTFTTAPGSGGYYNTALTLENFPGT